MLFYLLLLVVTSNLDYFDGCVNVTVVGFGPHGAISNDGQRIYISLNTLHNQTLVFQNTGIDFTHISTIPSSEAIIGLSLSSSGDQMLIQTNTSFEILETMNLSVKQQSTLVVSNRFGAIFSPDQQIILFLSIGLVKIYTKGETEYQFFQEVNDSSVSLQAVSISEEGNYFGVGEASSGKLFVYKKQGNYVLQQVIEVSSTVYFIKITEKGDLVLIHGGILSWWKNDGVQFIEMGNLNLGSLIYSASITDDLNLIYANNITGGVFLIERKMTQYYVMHSEVMSQIPFKVYVDRNGFYFMSILVNGSLTIRYRCPEECISCHMPNNCISCVDGFVLVSGVCHPKPTNCVRNVMVADGICQEYCSRECKTCNTTRGDCYECSSLYRRNQAGECVIASPALALVVKARFFLNFVKRGNFKFTFFAIDDLWLYSYHQKEYDGIVRQVLDIIQLVEEKQWELVGLSELKESVEESVQQVQLYNAYSNERHMEEARHNDVFVGSTVDFFVFCLPALLVFVFLCNRLFYLLFNHRASFLLRPYSFWAVLLELALQSNIEYFTFLGLRSLGIPFSFSHPSKWLLVLAVTMFFLVVFTAFISYALYYCWYGKLARYFLVNMYRFPSSYGLMIFLYGLRPFMKGLAHALFHSHFVLQLQVLAAIEVAMIMLTLGFELCIGNHKSRKVLTLELLYMGCLVVLNILLLLKHHYLTEDSQKIESYLELLVYCMIILLVLRLFFEVVVESISKECLKSVCCFCCRKTSKVTPMSEASPEPKADEQNKQSPEVYIDQANNFLLQLYRRKLAPTFTFRKSKNRKHSQ